MNLGGEHLTADDEHARIYGDRREPVAPMCIGPGHLYEYDEDGIPVFLEPCPVCADLPIRNHWGHRYVGVEGW